MKKIFLVIIMLIFIRESSIFSHAESFDILDKYIAQYVNENPFDKSFENPFESQVEEKVSNDIQSESQGQNLYSQRVVLGDEQILNDEYRYLIDGKRVGAIVNQTSVNANGQNLKDVLYNYKNTKLTSLYAPEHGIDGNIKAGDYVSTRKDVSTGLPVYSLYGDTREPSKALRDRKSVV